MKKRKQGSLEENSKIGDLTAHCKPIPCYDYRDPPVSQFYPVMIFNRENLGQIQKTLLSSQDFPACSLFFSVWPCSLPKSLEDI